ncbi:MAG: sulfatase [Gemmatimonadetes bacterium]|nr:sulfatase [Gemmatimonadota bacterium]MYD27185.1 sulfatase [Gemmatimonadota bacterium]MYI98941.1 sulfatase [Gemmatimonadota bacterium]
MSGHPAKNIVFVFSDQHRWCSTGFGGSRQVRTPYMDRMADEGVVFDLAVSNIPVCTPWRAAFLTGQYPLTTGMFMNDVRLPTDRPTLGTVLRAAGYDTAYIGKWHLDGPSRSGHTPPGPRRQGFDFWAVGNCTHDYMHSLYYRDSEAPLYWNGYDAEAQTSLAIKYLRTRERDRPFALVLSWGPPHNPYDAVPGRYLDLYPPEEVEVRPNCPDPARTDLAGYYAHITALDDQLARLGGVLEEQGLMDETIFVYTSDHGDMLGSQGRQRKQHPWDESIHVPFVMRCPDQADQADRADQAHARLRIGTPFNVVDIMPTLLGLAGIPVPGSCEGRDHAPAVRGEAFTGNDAAYIMSIAPFSEYRGQPWRGIRTAGHTYVRNLDGPWLLYDNREDPCQLSNLAGREEHADLQRRLDDQLHQEMARRGDALLPAGHYLERFGYEVNEAGAVPYETAVPPPGRRGRPEHGGTT